MLDSCPLQLRPVVIVETGGPATYRDRMAASKIRIREDVAAGPICPHCGKDIQEIAAQRVDSMLGVRFLYYCINCRKVLGLSHRKGFWMG